MANVPDTAYDKYMNERFDHIINIIKNLEQLHDYKIIALKELYEQRATAAEKTLDVAKASLNEMRGMASDQATAFLRRDEYNANFKSLEG